MLNVNKTLCDCQLGCGKWLSRRQIQRHHQRKREELATVRPRATLTSLGNSAPAPTKSDSISVDVDDADAPTVNNDIPIPEPEEQPFDVQHFFDRIEESVTRPLLPDWISSSESELDVDDGASIEEDDDDEVYDSEDEDRNLTPEEVEELIKHVYGEEWQKELWAIRNETLTEQDKDDIRMFALRIEGLLSRKIFNRIRRVFRSKLHLSTEWIAQHRIGLLAGVTPALFDCCISSCMCFTGDNSDLTECKFCKEPRYDSEGKPRQQFSYIPLIPRLQSIFQSKDAIKQHSYRANRDPLPHHSCDKFDSEHYKDLCDSFILLRDGSTLPIKYFSDSRDIALGLSADGVSIWKEKRRKGSPTCWPLLLVNYNLPPDIRNRLAHLICLGVIPGPKQPKDLGSYLAPFLDELYELLEGVSTFDAESQQSFLLRAYLISIFGDMPAIAKLMDLKGHNAIRPCRACLLRGVLSPSNHYYYPIEHPHDHDGDETVRTYDVTNLAVRTHESYFEAVSDIRECETQKARKEMSSWWGVNTLSVFALLSTIDLSKCFPHDFMHLLFENIFPNLFSLWSGTGKWADIDEGTGRYRIPESVWVKIGEETANAVKTIPSQFVSHIFNIHEARTSFKAETWCFWFLFIAPIVLYNRFPQPKYYRHMCELISIVHRCLRLEFPLHDLEKLESDIQKWVLDYEKLYYQHTKDRLMLCPLTHHALLHIPSDIRNSGPVWTNWAFVMERFAGSLVTAVKSRLHPWGSLNMRALRIAQLNSLRFRFDISEILGEAELDADVSRREVVLPDYPLSILRFPRQCDVPLEGDLERRVALHFSRIFGVSRTAVQPLLPDTVTKWGKVRIDGGDSIRSKWGTAIRRETRDSSFVRYSAMMANPRAYRGEDLMTRVIGYGQLNYILECTVQRSRTLGLNKSTTYLLAEITPCNTNGKDATAEPVFYESMKAATIVDLRLVESVVGRVRREGLGWGIIDRSNGEARTIFEAPEDDDDA